MPAEAPANLPAEYVRPAGGGLIAMPAFIQAIPPQQRLSTLFVLLATIALIVGAWTWMRTPDYQVLYANLEDRDGGAVVAALQQMNVPYRISEGGGTILAPGDQVPELRLKLAGQGLPKGSIAGFEIMENQKFGASEFLEQVNYQRALEGELARSVQSLSAVQGARVHLAIAKPSVFVRERQKPSASVLVNLYPGRTLDPGQVSAVMHLVASSVPDLPVQNITVVDQNGTLLSNTGADDNGLDPNQLKYVSELETGYMKRIEAILTPIVGAENVRAQVTADVDFTQAEHAEETYKPNQDPANAVIRSQQTSETTSVSGGSTPSGIPGALSNQPPGNASAPLDAAANSAAAPAAGTAGAGATPALGPDGKPIAKPAAAAPTPPMNTQKDATTNYEVDRTIRHVRQSVGSVRRLSAAVVINEPSETGADGKTAPKPLTPAQMEQITNLVKEAMGYSADRGDTVNIANAPFTTEPPVGELPLWKQPQVIGLAKEIGRYVLGAALVLYLIFGILKPMLKRQAAARPPAPMMPPQAAYAAAPGGPAHAGDAYEQNLENTRQIAREQPKVVANVVKQWVGT